MPALKGLFYVLFALASAGLMAMAIAMSGDRTMPAWAMLLVLAALGSVLAGSLRLGLQERPGLAICTMIFGLPAAMVVVLVLWLAIAPGNLH